MDYWVYGAAVVALLLILDFLPFSLGSGRSTRSGSPQALGGPSAKHAGKKRKRNPGNRWERGKKHPVADDSEAPTPSPMSPRS